MQIAHELKERFAWLGTDDDANGADTIDILNEWYAELMYEAVIADHEPPK